MPTYAKGRVEPANLDHLIALSHARHGARLRAMRAAVTPPATWDSRALGVVGPVKDQGQCGSCWDFSGTGVVEIALNGAGIGGGPNKMILSEQYTLSCGKNGGCGGDDNTTVLAWAEATGLPLTSAYGPYTGAASSCSWSSSQQLYKIPSWGFADSNGGQGVTSELDIKLAIMAYWCVGAAIAADDAFMNNPPGTVFKGSGSNQIDHDIILVGWGDGWWILRNSWGSSWCDAGYCNIEFGANQVGTESVFAMVAPAPAPTPSPGPPLPNPPGPVGGTLVIDLGVRTITTPEGWTVS